MTAEPDVDVPAVTLRSIAPSVFLPALVYEIGDGAIAPIIALTALDVGASPGTAGFMLALLGIGQILGDVPAGRVADTIGDRRAMTIASGIAAAVAVALAPPTAPLAPAVAYAPAVALPTFAPVAITTPRAAAAPAPPDAPAADSPFTLHVEHRLELTAPGSAVGIASPMWKASGSPLFSMAAQSGSIRGWLYWMVRPSANLPGLIGIIRQRAPSSAQRTTLSSAASGSQ